jgi:hypothetical protein
MCLAWANLQLYYRTVPSSVPLHTYSPFFCEIDRYEQSWTCVDHVNLSYMHIL